MLCRIEYPHFGYVMIDTSTLERGTTHHGSLVVPVLRGKETAYDHQGNCWYNDAVPMELTGAIPQALLMEVESLRAQVAELRAQLSPSIDSELPCGGASCSPGQGCGACSRVDAQLGAEAPQNPPQNSKEALS